MRVPIPPPESWPKHPISITLKNLGDSFIQYNYSEDGITKHGILANGQISEQPTRLFVNTVYTFNFKSGATIRSTQ